MASKISVAIKNLTKKRKINLCILVSCFILFLIISIQSVYAYYHESLTSGVLANKVGDFDLGDGDINMLLYKLVDGKPVRIYAIPDAYYAFNDTLTSCLTPNSQKVTCNDGTGNCEYAFDSVSRSFTLTSNQQLTCKFYFEEEGSSDVNVYVYIENENGTDYTYSVVDTAGNTTSITKKYVLSDNIPAYGYEYINSYRCDNEATLTYDSTTRKFTVLTQTKNNCYVYFNSVGASDITANVYVQTTYGSDAYTEVTSIPTNRVYALNTTKSYCYTEDGTNTGVTITYENGYINVPASERQTCDVYLDLQEE